MKLLDKGEIILLLLFCVGMLMGAMLATVIFLFRSWL
jgi:hypothetical protein